MILGPLHNPIHHPLLLRDLDQTGDQNSKNYLNPRLNFKFSFGSAHETEKLYFSPVTVAFFCNKLRHPIGHTPGQPPPCRFFNNKLRHLIGHTPDQPPPRRFFDNKLRHPIGHTPVQPPPHRFFDNKLRHLIGHVPGQLPKWTTYAEANALPVF